MAMTYSGGPTDNILLLPACLAISNAVGYP